jgi:hypothetical protein
MFDKNYTLKERPTGHTTGPQGNFKTVRGHTGKVDDHECEIREALEY